MAIFLERREMNAYGNAMLSFVKVFATLHRKKKFFQNGTSVTKRYFSQTEQSCKEKGLKSPKS
jgi:hypothetical protein